MTNLLKKAGLGVALAATALTTAAPAEAQYYRGYRGYHGYHRHHGDAAGAAILGGIVGLGVGAAIASNNRGGYGYNRGYYNGGYNNGGYYDYAQPRPYYNDYRRCWTERRFDPYYGTPVRVRVCN